MELLKLSSPCNLGVSPSLKPTTTNHKPLHGSLTFNHPPRRPSLRASPTLMMAPLAAESDGMGTQEDAMERLLKERIVFLGHDIDDFVADAIVSQLLLLDVQDPTRDIRLFLNSRGGSLSAAMAIYDVIQLVRADVSTVALGTTEATASLVLGGGTRGKRFSMPNSRIMITQPKGSINGTIRAVEVQAEETMTSKRTVVSLISGFTGRTEEQVKMDIDRDRFMSPIEAVEYGIIDGVIDRDRILPFVPLPERVRATRFKEFTEDPVKFLTPDVPDDEIF